LEMNPKYLSSQIIQEIANVKNLGNVL
jgi:hypothetical protein